jgi:phosphatidate cytidylyltransferase
MKNRILATLVLWALVILLPWFLDKWGAFILIGIFGVGSYLELLDLMNRAGRPVDRMVGLVAFTLMLLGFMAIPPWIMPPFALVCFILAGGVIATLLNSNVGTFTAVAPPTIGSVFILGVPLSAAILMFHEYGLVFPIWVVAVTKFGDVGALLTGMWIGKHRMAPAYSPKKTWEGLAGGVVLSIVISVAYTLWFREWMPEGVTLLHAGWMALFITVSGVLADLTESAFKREAKVKDSGSFIPGIGGFLDLSDSLMLAFPVAYFLTWLVI